MRWVVLVLVCAGAGSFAVASSGVPGDLDGDYYVGQGDLKTFLDGWVLSHLPDATPDPTCDLNGDGKLDHADAALLLEALGRVSGEDVTASGTAVLPAGTTGSASVLTAAGRALLSAEGGFTVAVTGLGPSLAVVEDGAGKPVLLGWVGGDEPGGPVLNARSTAAVLLFLNVGGFTLPPGLWARAQQLIAEAPALDALADTVGARLEADPGVLVNGDAAIVAALESAAASFTGAGGVTSQALLIDPLGETKSGVDLNALAGADNTVQALNWYRRRAWMFVIWEKDVFEDGSEVENPDFEIDDGVVVKRSFWDARIPATAKLSSPISTVVDWATGTHAWAATPGPTCALPTPFQTAWVGDKVLNHSEYTVLVVGPGAAAPPGTPKAARDKIGQLQMETFAFDVFLPCLSFAVSSVAALEQLSTNESNRACAEFLEEITAAVLASGDVHEALRDGKVHETLWSLLKYLAEHPWVQDKIAVSAGKALAEVTGKVFDKKPITDLLRDFSAIYRLFCIAMTTADLGAVCYHWKNSNEAECWSVKALPLERPYISPRQAVTRVEGTVPLEVHVPGGEWSPADIAFTWYCEGNVGYFTDDHDRDLGECVTRNGLTSINYTTYYWSEPNDTDTVRCQFKLGDTLWELLAEIKIAPVEVELFGPDTLGASKRGAFFAHVTGPVTARDEIRYTWELRPVQGPIGLFFHGADGTSWSGVAISQVSWDTIGYHAPETGPDEAEAIIYCKAQGRGRYGIYRALAEDERAVKILPRKPFRVRLAGSWKLLSDDPPPVPFQWAVGVEFDKIPGALSYRIEAKGDFNDPLYWGDTILIRGPDPRWDSNKGPKEELPWARSSDDCYFVRLTGGSAGPVYWGAWDQCIADAKNRFTGAEFWGWVTSWEEGYPK